MDENLEPETWMMLLLYTFLITAATELINYIGGYGKGQLDPVLTNVKKLLEDKTLDVRSKMKNEGPNDYRSFIPQLTHKLNYNRDPIDGIINFNDFIKSALETLIGSGSLLQDISYGIQDVIFHHRRNNANFRSI